MNPLTVDVQQELRALLGQIREDRNVRALVITGEGRAFSAGGDIASMRPGAGETRSLGEVVGDGMKAVTNPLVEELRELPVPIVAAVNGACAGAGVGLALAADVVVAARSAYFLLPFFPRLGIVPDFGASTFLLRRGGYGRAMALSLLGERLSAERAEQWGLVWACFDDAALQSEALALARRLARLPAHCALEARRLFDSAALKPLAEQLAYEASRQRALMDLPTLAEGVQAFMEKRDPRFPGR
jgi:2-(1,2-epoxy-1,2-dihydrophenyl)acetyl-CoA isomerase